LAPRGAADAPIAGWAVTGVFVVLTWVLFRATSFEAALALYKALAGFAPPGQGFKWRTRSRLALH